MAPHSSTLAWKIPWTEEPGRLQSMGSLRVGHDWTTSLWLFTFMHWRRKWQPTPMFLPGESQGRGSLLSCCLWGRTESDMIDATCQQQQQHQWSSMWVCYLEYLIQLSLQIAPVLIAIWLRPHMTSQERTIWAYLVKKHITEKQQNVFKLLHFRIVHGCFATIDKT